MKLKIEIRSWNDYLSPPPPHTHTHTYRLTLHPRTITYGAKLFSGTTQYQKFLLSPKKTCSDYIKLHCAHGNPSGTVAGSFASRLKTDTCMPHILSWIFFSSTNLRKVSCQLLAKQHGR